MKGLRFIINSNIFIALSAVLLTIASQVELSNLPEFHLYLVVIFLATVFDYNLHRYLAIKYKPENRIIEKYKWHAEHLTLLKTFIVVPLTGLIFSILFTEIRIIVFLGLLAALTFLYSMQIQGRTGKHFHLLKITGMKTALIALAWTAVSLFIPIIQTGKFPPAIQLILLTAGRFFFISAVAIPFDIRDVKSDREDGLGTLPIAFGEKKAVIISTCLLLLSFSVSLTYALFTNKVFLVPAYIISVSGTLLVINHKKLVQRPLYYHGLLDGCILFYGLLIWLSYYFRT